MKININFLLFIFYFITFTAALIPYNISGNILIQKKIPKPRLLVGGQGKWSGKMDANNHHLKNDGSYDYRFRENKPFKTKNKIKEFLQTPQMLSKALYGGYLSALRSAIENYELSKNGDFLGFSQQLSIDFIWGWIQTVIGSIPYAGKTYIICAYMKNTIKQCSTGISEQCVKTSAQEIIRWGAYKGIAVGIMTLGPGIFASGALTVAGQYFYDKIEEKFWEVN